MITCEWHLVPKVPLSKKGFSYQTHWSSIYCLAFTLSTALTIMSRLYQNYSLKYYSVSGPTFNLIDYSFECLFIFLPMWHATSLLFLPTWFFLNKNCLFKLLISILSSSVHKTRPLSAVPKPISANIFINSQPSAPAPTRKAFIFATF